MAERDRIERLNEALEGGALDDRVPLAADVGELLAVARRLRGMPREEFRQRLRFQLEEKAMTGTTATETIQLREGFRSLTPYIIVRGGAAFIDFMKEVFGAEEKLRVPRPDGSIMHAEVNIGDSMIELADGNEQYSSRPSAIHLYVPDAQLVYDRALAAGATSLHPVEEMHYGELSGSVQDPFGNHWYIATYHGPNYIPEGLHTVNPSLLPVGADGLIAYLKEAFGAEEMEVFRRPEGGPIVHAKIRLGDTILEMGEAHGPYGPMPTGLHFYVPDVDVVYERALKAGGTSISATSPMAKGVLELRIRRGIRGSWRRRWDAIDSF